MKLIHYLEHRFQELSFHIQSTTQDKAFDIETDSEMKAVHTVLDRYRAFKHVLWIPKVLYHFLLVKMGWKEEPVPVILNMMKEKEAKKAEDEAIAKTASLMATNVTSIHSDTTTTQESPCPKKTN